MSNWSALIHKVHLQCGGYSGGAVKFTYTSFWAWETTLSVSFISPNQPIYIFGFEYSVI